MARCDFRKNCSRISVPRRSNCQLKTDEYRSSARSTVAAVCKYCDFARSDNGALYCIHPSSLLQSRYAKPTGDFCHLRLRKCFALLDGLLHCAEDNFFEKFYVIGIDYVPVDFDCHDIACTVRRNFYLPASRADFDCLLLKLSLSFCHLLLHFLSLLHQFV